MTFYFKVIMTFLIVTQIFIWKEIKENVMVGMF